MRTEERTAARALMMSPGKEVLLMEMDLPWLGRVWMVPGGGVEPGESLREAAQREAREETGAALERVGEELWWRDVKIEHEGRRILLREHYFLVEIEKFEPSRALLEEDERGWLLGYRWWGVSELKESPDPCAPPEIGVLLERLVTDGRPIATIQLQTCIHAG